MGAVQSLHYVRLAKPMLSCFCVVKNNRGVPLSSQSFKLKMDEKGFGRMPMDTKRTLALLLIVIAAASITSPTMMPYAARGSNRSASLEQGKYLVESVTICFECHSECDFSKPGWPIPSGRVGSGRILWGEGSPNQVIAPNITPDVATGIGE